MSEETHLARAQADRWAALDPLLPTTADVPEGDVLVATLRDGSRVAAVLRLATAGPAPPGVWELVPLLGDHGTEGMDAVLRACRAHLDQARPVPGAACAVVWPSRDAGGIRALLDHGLVPVCALAVRKEPGPDAAGSADVLVRPAGPDDAAVRALLRTEGTCSPCHDCGQNFPLPEGGGSSRAWLAERSGRVVAVATGGWTEVTEPGAALPPGRWGGVGCVAVAPAARAHGVGRALLAAVHADYARDSVTGSFVCHDPLDPVSPVFWHRQGYRPLWTRWEVRPASRLR